MGSGAAALAGAADLATLRATALPLTGSGRVSEETRKRIAALDHDKTQAELIERMGAKAVSADISNIGPMFNNGNVDTIIVPTIAYFPFELQKGMGTKGAVIRMPLTISTYQMIIRHDQFPDGFGAKSRTFWAGQFDRALALIVKAENDIPKSAWSEVSDQIMTDYTVLLRESRITAAEQGLYDKQGLKIIKRVRCSVNPADAECSSSSENWN